MKATAWVEAVAHAYRGRGSQSIRHVAAVLALYADHASGANAYPSGDTLVALTGLRRSLVYRALATLTADGWLVTVKGGRGSRRVVRRLSYPPGVGASEDPSRVGASEAELGSSEAREGSSEYPQPHNPPTPEGGRRGEKGQRPGADAPAADGWLSASASLLGRVLRVAPSTVAGWAADPGVTRAVAEALGKGGGAEHLTAFVESHTPGLVKSPAGLLVWWLTREYDASADYGAEAAAARAGRENAAAEKERRSWEQAGEEFQALAERVREATLQLGYREQPDERIDKGDGLGWFRRRFEDPKDGDVFEWEEVWFRDPDEVSVADAAAAVRECTAALRAKVEGVLW